MQTEASNVRLRTGRPLVWILEDRLPGIELSQLVSAGILAFEIAEIPQISEATKCLSTPDNHLDLRLKAILASSLQDCMRIAEKFESVNDSTSAIEWMSNGVAAFKGFSVARVKLFQLLLNLGRLDEADAVGREALLLRPDASGLVLAMERLAIRRSRPEEASKWRAWYNIKCQTPQPVTFDSLVSSISQNHESRSVQVADLAKQRQSD
jgi:hypothetical protein